MRHLVRLLAPVALGLALGSMLTPAPASAQIRASEMGQVAQTIDGTTLTLQYSRPSARGRDLFGALVPWNVVWTPGANWATRLDVDRDVRLNGTEVPAGQYSVWMIPREDRWTLTLNPNAELFHFQKPDSAADQIHVAVEPEEAEHVEMLTWSFPTVAGDGAILRMNWGTTAVPVRVVVQPTKPVKVAAERRKHYLGEYALDLVEGIGWPTESTLVVYERDGMLRGRMPFPIHPGDELEFDLVPAGDNRFSPGIYRDGSLFNVEPGFTFEFDVDEDMARATAVRLRGVEGSVFGEGQPHGGARGG